METRRQLLHIAVGSGALTLRWLTWPQAVLLAIIAIAFNAFVLPRILPQVLRAADRTRSWNTGVILYPVAVLALILVFRHDLPLAAMAWAILAVGDGMATLVGIHVKSPALSWNANKSVAGLVSFLIFGSAAAAGTLWWSSPAPVSAWLLSVGILAATVAAFAETVPIALDDNITVPAVTTLILWSTGDTQAAVLLTHLTAQLAPTNTLVWSLMAVNAAAALLGWRAGLVTGMGSVTGAAIGGAMIVGGGAPGWLMLIATFLIASGTTRLGHARKAAAGIAEDRGGRRGPGNAIANTGLAAWAALVAAGLTDPTLAHLALVAALATAGGDTVASEVGKAWGRTAWQITTRRQVPPGTTGAVSLEGTGAGAVASVGLASLGAAVGLVPIASIPLIGLAATVASLLEGVIGATLEARGMLTNDVVNFVNSAMGAGLTLTAWSLL